jgi:ABC-type lipoprotein export system ATPase subunit/GNAT superfamily N-acetyltransferase
MTEFVITTPVVLDEETKKFCSTYDYTPDVENTTTLYLPDLTDKKWQIGCMYGPSGTGKTTIGLRLGKIHTKEWDQTKSIISQLSLEACAAVGLHSIPSLVRPYHILSLGEQKRCDMAALLMEKESTDVIFVDEFCSALDVPTSLSLAKNFAKYVRKNRNYKVLFASQRLEVLTMLRPDWIYNTRQFEFIPVPPPMKLWKMDIRRLEGAVEKRRVWGLFKQHHYMTENFNVASHCYLAVREDTREWIGFCAVLAQPGRIPHMWRGHRLVILPEYQGLSYGVKLDEHVAQLLLNRGKRFYSRTIHPRLGEYRERSEKWRATTKNRVYHKGMHGETKTRKKFKHLWARLSYSHEFIGTGGIQ